MWRKAPPFEHRHPEVESPSDLQSSLVLQDDLSKVHSLSAVCMKRLLGSPAVVQTTADEVKRCSSFVKTRRQLFRWHRSFFADIKTFTQWIMRLGMNTARKRTTQVDPGKHVYIESQTSGLDKSGLIKEEMHRWAADNRRPRNAFRERRKSMKMMSLCLDSDSNPWPSWYLKWQLTFQNLTRRTSIITEQMGKNCRIDCFESWILLKSALFRKNSWCNNITRLLTLLISIGCENYYRMRQI